MIVEGPWEGNERGGVMFRDLFFNWSCREIRLVRERSDGWETACLAKYSIILVFVLGEAGVPEG